jgi:hypothetical protein
MINLPADIDAAHNALASLYCALLERELSHLLPTGTSIVLTDGTERIPGSIQRHTLYITKENIVSIHLELSGSTSPAGLGAELTLELRAHLPAAIPCRLKWASPSGRHADVTVALLADQPTARVQKKLPSAAECQHFLELNADDLCVVLTRGSFMEPHELAPRCKDALRLLFSESARVAPAQVCHELARTLAALLAEADEHPLLWPDHIRQKAADLLDQLNRLYA